jgi:hypothetical protein
MDRALFSPLDLLVVPIVSGFRYPARVCFTPAIESIGHPGLRAYVRRGRRGGRLYRRGDAGGHVLQGMERAGRRWLGSGRRFVSDALRPPGGILGVQRWRSGGLSPRPRNLGVLVFMLCIAGHAAGSLHLLADHRNDGVVGKPAFSRTIVVQDVTKPKLTLLHSTGLQTSSLAGKGTAKGP